MIVLFISCSAVVVECLRLNPCWCGGNIILFVMYGRMIFSEVTPAIPSENKQSINSKGQVTKHYVGCNFALML